MSMHLQLHPSDAMLSTLEWLWDRPSVSQTLRASTLEDWCY